MFDIEIGHVHKAKKSVRRLGQKKIKKAGAYASVSFAVCPDFNNKTMMPENQYALNQTAAGAICMFISASFNRRASKACCTESQATEPKPQVKRSWKGTAAISRK